MAVLVVGSVNIDMVVRVERLPAAGETVIGGTFSRHPGGKGGNQAVAAARMGATVRFVGAVGNDDLGRGALEDLAGEGVDVSAVARLPDVATGVAAIVVDARGDNQIAVASGANAHLTGEHVERALRSRVHREDVVLVGFEVGDEAVLAAARRARAAGARLVVNPAPARALPRGLVECSPLLVPNATEAAMLTGHDDPALAARTLSLIAGAPCVVTLGADGAWLAEGARSRHLEAVAVRAVDTTGAGDTLAGALAAEWARGAPLEDALTIAMAAAAISVTVVGARDGMPARDAALALGGPT